MKLTLIEATQQLIGEMDFSLSMGEIRTLDDHVEMVNLHYKRDIYGTFILITDQQGTVQSASYLGKYPGLSEGLPLQDKVDLDLDTRVLYPTLCIKSPEALVRIDHHKLPFLGTRYDGWDRDLRTINTYLLPSRAARYNKRILDHPIIFPKK